MTPASTSNSAVRVRAARRRTLASLALAVVASWAPPQPAGSGDTIEPAVLVQMEERVVEAAQQALAASVGLKIKEGRTEGDGSGVIVSEDGYVLTVAHNFTEPGTPIRVHLPDGRQVSGIGLGRNERGDYALVKILGDGPFPFVELGDSDALERDQLCVMTGHAGGIHRDRPPVVRVGTYMREVRGYWLRSECAMMPGDSGGALFDLDGDVVGINSYIEESVDANFHVPVSSFEEQWERLAVGETWNWTRESRYRSSGRDLGEGGSLGLVLDEDDDGVFVVEVVEAYQADEAGIEAGDRVLAVDGTRTSSLTRYWRELRGAERDDVFVLRVQRGEKELEIEVPYARYERSSR